MIQNLGFIPMTSSPVRRTGLPCTILCVDVCGSTKLYDALGNTRALAVIGKALALLSQAASRHSGTIVKTIGDELMCTFSTVGDAATAAEDMQRSLRQSILNGELDVKSLAVRVGLHSGPVISYSADIFGGAVLVAKRVTAEAKPGQILIGKETLRWLPNAIAARTRLIGSTEIKGEQEPFELFELIWDNDNHNVTLGQDTLENASTPELECGSGKLHSTWVSIDLPSAWAVDEKMKSLWPNRSPRVCTLKSNGGGTTYF
jgi:adenylate cyclase